MAQLTELVHLGQKTGFKTRRDRKKISYDFLKKIPHRKKFPMSAASVSQ